MDIEMRDDMTREIEILRQERADLASALNALLRESRAVRLFNTYRRIRSRVADLQLRLPNRNTTARPIAQGATLHQRPQDSSYDVFFMSCGDWRWRYQRPQHLATQLADHGHRVFFLSPDFRPPVNPAYARPKKGYAVRVVHPRVFEVRLAGSRKLRPMSRRMLASDTQDLLQSCQSLWEDFDVKRAVSMVELPFWTPVALGLREQHGAKVIYDLIDRWYGVLPRSYSMLAEERAILRQADLVVATARLLRDEATVLNPATCLIPNAADLEHFSSCPTTTPAHDLDTGRPIIGYFGSLGSWFDVELVHAAAQKNPGWTFVIIGSGEADTRELSRLDNVKLLGEMPYQELPAYAHAFDVCMIPFRPSPVIATTDPVKFYEYLAAGKPVVTTDMPELRAYSDVTYTGTTPEEFAGQIDLALAQDSEAKRKQRVEFARRHTWEVRFEDLNEAILALLEGAPAADEPQVPPVDARSPASDIAAPLLLELAPSAVRVNSWPDELGSLGGELCLQGSGLTPDCVALVDEQPIETRFQSSTEIRCQVPPSFYRAPGCLMISVVDQNTWRQSNRRAFLVEQV